MKKKKEKRRKDLKDYMFLGISRRKYLYRVVRFHAAMMFAKDFLRSTTIANTTFL